MIAITEGRQAGEDIVAAPCTTGIHSRFGMDAADRAAA